MQKKWTILVVLLVSLFLVSMVVAAPNAFSIDWWLVGGGGGRDTASGVSLSSALGQWAVGSDAVNDVQLCAGFWCVVGEQGPPTNFEHWVYLPLVLRNLP